ncbi:hypothetical protein PPL_12121 [Heterostelium album PN500]|uniref:Uncharacterized protein n=1 Tax=Heterostelium pallidum (strain ATCC 26659 / Pp 5 / PN500) TaxID=670386 RepID=D3BLR8_HETP5|nr:hypothetical protein PPL_12121 [Heterostelium album PN500]EFA77519.1 hypothetical protein PPL_12121 [Heterostelium album PN500]|eukprot:XP_020429647.1 hypothetical protein PPL_12121 [Heterostelium album PN500]
MSLLKNELIRLSIELDTTVYFQEKDGHFHITVKAYFSAGEIEVTRINYTRVGTNNLSARSKKLLTLATNTSRKEQSTPKDLVDHQRNKSHWSDSNSIDVTTCRSS